MTFLYPAVLFGLAALAIPVIIHLFNFRRPKRVAFSSLLFLQSIQKTAVKRLRLKQWLLLALRILAFSALILAFARPSIPTSYIVGMQAAPDRSVALIIDDSGSMSLRTAQGALIDQALTVAEAFLRSLQVTDDVLLVSTSDGDRIRSAVMLTPNEALDRITDLAPRAQSTTLSETIALASERLDLEARHASREVVVLSDLQTSTLSDSTTVAVDRDIPVRLVAVGDGRPGLNQWIDDLTLESRILQAGRALAVTGGLRASGPQSSRTVAAAITLDGVAVARASARTAEGQNTPIRFSLTPKMAGWLHGTLEIDPDDYDRDNSRPITLYIPAETRVAVWAPDPAVFSLISLMLEATMDDSLATLRLNRIESVTDLQEISRGQYEVTLVAGPWPESIAADPILSPFVENGGGLVILGDAAPSLAPTIMNLGGGTISNQVGRTGSTTPVTTFGEADQRHPIFSGLYTDATIRERQLEQPPIFTYVSYSKGLGAESTLLSAQNGDPLLQEIPFGAGTTLLYTTSLNPAWSQWAYHGISLPMLHRSIQYVTGSPVVTLQGWTVGEPVTFQIQGSQADETIRIEHAEGDVILPDVRTLMGTRQVNWRDGPSLPGRYTVLAGNTKLFETTAIESAQESDLTFTPPEDAATILTGRLRQPVAGIRIEDTVEATVASLEATRTGIEIWHLFVVLALLALAAESVVARTMDD